MAEGYSAWGYQGTNGMRGHVVAWCEYTDNSHYNIIVTGNTQCSSGCGAGWQMQSQVGYDARYSGIPGTSSGAGQHTSSWDWCTEAHNFESVEGPGWADYHKETFGPFQCDTSEHDFTVWYKCWSRTGGWGAGERDAFATATAPVYKQHTPYVPSNFAVSRVSDTSQKLSWDGNYTGLDGLYSREYVYVERRVDGGAWAQVAKVVWSVHNWTDNSTTAGHKYEYRVRADNRGDGTTRKYSGYSDVIPVYTSPVALTTLVASKSSESAVTLAATGTWTWRDGIEAQIKSGSTAWADVALQDVDTSTWQDASAPAGTVKYRIRAFVKQGGSTSSSDVLRGAWAESNEIVTICPPNAPAVATDTVVAKGETLDATWKPSHPDGSAQSAAQAVLYDKSGAKLQQVNITGAAVGASFDTSGLTLGTYLVRVRTKGLDASWGTWSDYVSAAVSAYPSVTITSPAADYDGTNAEGKLPIPVTWDAACDDGIAYHTVEVLDAQGNVLNSARLSGDARNIDLGAAIGFTNQTSYSVRITAYGGGGLSTAATRAFYTDWLLPDAAAVKVQYDERLAALIRVTSSKDEDESDTEVVAATSDEASTIADTSETVDIVDYDICRVNPDGTRLVLGEHLKLGYTIEDTLPPLNTEYTYEVTTRSAQDTVNVKVVPVTCDSDGMEAFNFGSAAQEAVLLGYDATSTETAEMSGQSYNFALGSLTPILPTFYPDGTLGMSRSLTYVVHDRETYEKVCAISRVPAYACFWYRDAWGHRMYCHGKWTTGYSAKSYSLWDVSVTPTEVVWREPVNG